MYRLLIVEDELTAREAIRETIDWDFWGFTDLYTACNGEEALEICRQVQPHLIITDIRMPRMDGLEFARRMQILNPGCRIIILSAYQNPDYVHTAFRNQAFDYLLKPVKHDELMEAVARRIQELIRDCARDHVLETVTPAVRGSLTSIREQIIRICLHGSAYAHELWRVYCGLFEGSESARLRYSVICIVVQNSEHAVPTGLDELENSLHEYAGEDHDSRFDFTQAVRMDNHTIVYVLGIDAGVEERDTLAESLECEIMKNAASLGLGLVRKFRTGWTDTLADIAPHFTRLYRLACGENNPGVSQNTITPHEEGLAREIKEIIEERFVDESMSVKSIANMLTKSSAYLCMVFKKAYGHTITDYLNLTRVREAKRLLDGSDFKMYDVAYETGFSTENYFAKVFKKYENVTPTEYRERES